MTELLGLRKGEGQTIFYLMSYLTLQCFGTSLGIAIATSMLLAEVGADKLPYIFVGISFAALSLSSIYPVLMVRKGSQFTYRLYAMCGFLIVLACNLMIRNEFIQAGINVGVFLQYLAFFVLAGWDIMHFGNYSQTVLNPLQRKRLYGLILSATKLGGILGGICLGPLIKSMGQINVLIIWACSYLISGLVLVIFEKKIQFKESPSSRRKQTKNPGILQNLRKGFNEVLTNSFLVFFSLLIALDICTGSLMVYQFNEGLGQIFAGESEKLSAFLGQFAAIANGIALVLQIFLAPRLSTWLGVSWVNFFYPGFSVILLGCSLARWDLVVVTILMFHKDYLSSVIHLPNRILFYNAIAPEKRTFILGFLEGTWTHCVNLLFGVSLILIVQLGPTVSNFFSEGFSQFFSVFGLLLFLAYFYIAYKMKHHYNSQLLDVVKHEDYFSEIKNFELNTTEILEIESRLRDSALDYLDFIPAKMTDKLKSLYYKASIEQKWAICMRHPITLKAFHANINQVNRWDLFKQCFSKKITSQFNIAMSQDEVFKLFQENIQNQQVLKAILYYCLVYNYPDLIIKISKALSDFPKANLVELCDLATYFELTLIESSCETLLNYAMQLNQKDQIRILKGVSFSKLNKLMPRLMIFFGLPSISIRKQVVKTIMRSAVEEDSRNQYQELFFSRDWSYHARLTWFALFEEFPSNERKVLLAKILNIEKMRLLNLTQLQVNLENSKLSVQGFLDSVKEELRNQCNFLLIYFRSEFDKDSLEVVRKALFQKKSERRYEAIELLASTGKVEICDLLLPFLELEQGDQRLKALNKINGTNLVHCDITESIKKCLNGPDEWLRACALEWIAKHKQVNYLETVKSLPKFKDLISSEMTLHCLKELQTP